MIIKNSIKTFLVADHTKYDRVAFVKVADLEQFEGIIVDSPLPEEILNELSRRNVKVFWT